MIDFDLQCSLLDHQRAAATKLQRLKVGGLFMEMGTGKTVTAIELIRQRAKKISNVIYFTPVNLKLSVALEFARWAPQLSVNVFGGKTKDKNIPKSNVYIVGVESIGQSDRITLAANSLITQSSCIILDESDTCKNHAALRTMRITAMSARARYRFALTGTAVGEGVVDLYAQMKFLSPEILGYKSFYSFAANHLEYSEDYPGLIVRSLRTDHIAKKIEPFVYQVTKAECLSLPDKLYRAKYCDLTVEQSQLYQRAKEDILMSCEEIDSYTIFRLFTALREIVSGFWNDTPHPGNKWRHPEQRPAIFRTCQHNRLYILDEALEEIPRSEKVIVWANFEYSINQICRHLSEAYGPDQVCDYYGKTENKNRQIKRWRNESRFLVASPQCGGRGLTLNESAYVVFYNNDFPYRLRAQAEDRCHRIGQDRPPTYTDLVAVGGIDERIVAALANKESMAKLFNRELDKLQDPEKKRQKLLQL